MCPTLSTMQNTFRLTEHHFLPILKTFRKIRMASIILIIFVVHWQRLSMSKSTLLIPLPVIDISHIYNLTCLTLNKIVNIS